MSLSARVVRVVTKLALVLCFLFIGSPAQNLALAQTATRGRTLVSPVRGAALLGVGVAGDADARSAELNPGQIGLLEEASSAYAVSYWKDGVERAGRGGGLFLAAPTLVSRLLFAGSLQWLRPSMPGAEERYYKLALTPALRLGRGLGVGATWEHLFAGRYGGVDSFTLGLGVRLHPVVALGVVARDVNRPRADGLKVPVEWDGEAVLRPWLDDRLELTLGTRVWESHGDARWMPRARITARVWRGAYLFAEVDRPRFDLEWVTPSGQLTRATDYQVAAGLTVGFGRSGATLAGLRAVRDTDDGWPGTHEPFALGGHLSLHTTFGRHEALVERRHVARVKLTSLADDRHFIAAALRLRRLAKDDGAAAVLLIIDNLDVGMGRVEELRALVKALRAAGKPVVAYITTPITRDYYLAAACDAITMHPAGGLTLTGLAQTIVFYKGLMDKLGVNVDLVRIADWKSAMEPFVFQGSTEPAKQNRAALLGDIGPRLVAAIAEGRRFTPAATRALIDRGIFGAEDAKDARLVDLLTDEHGLDDALGKILGRKIPLRDAEGRIAPRRWMPTRVAVVMIDGPISEGKGGGLPFQSDIIAWSERVIDAIKGVRADPAVRAVVLRVNSPGGSAFASDEIAREIARLRAAGKIVVTSMGDAAASGGYYVAAPTETIYASPSTITGSIGIYSYKVDGRALADRLGLAAEVNKLGAHADFYSPYRPWTDEEKQLSLRRIDLLYQQFIGVVEKGRKHTGLTAAIIDRDLARGRVWTGAQGRGNGLVDETGGVVDAVVAAARRAGVPAGPDGLPEIAVVPPPATDPLEALLALRRFISTSTGAPLPAEGLLAAPLLRQGRAALRLALPVLAGRTVGYEARLPYEIEME